MSPPQPEPNESPAGVYTGTSADGRLEAYKIAIEMLKHDDTLFWSRNQLMLAINGVVATLVTWQWPGEALGLDAATPLLAVCGLGIVVNVAWLLVAQRSEAYFAGWYDQAMALEATYRVDDKKTAYRVFTVQEQHIDGDLDRIHPKGGRRAWLSGFRISAIIAILAGMLAATWTVVLLSAISFVE